MNAAPRVPEKPSLDGLEDKWTSVWEDQGIYRFDRSKTREQIYSIDTPPPTASGTLHVGSVFSYTHTDLVARFQRMRGREVFYPMGWDDNGLPTERRVQGYYGVTCDPQAPYDPEFRPPDEPFNPRRAISRRNFVECCLELTEIDERAFEELWRRLGLSVDWSRTYATIGRTARRAAQRSFLELLARGEAYQAEAPTLWDVDFQTAVAQAELEDRELAGTMHELRFGELTVESTRPELLGACVALVTHPDDERHRGLVGRTARVPLYGHEVPIHAHPLADPEKGSGLVMVCTFGDLNDVTWWRELRLPVRPVMQPDGTLGEPAGELAGLDAVTARARIAERLAASGELGATRPVRHPVKFYEKGERPLEIITSRQWFIRSLDHREALLGARRRLRWPPPPMPAR